MQRRHVDVRVAGDEVHLGSALDEKARRPLLAEEGRVVQRREAVRRPRLRELGLSAEQLLEPARPPDGSCVEDVERRIRVEQRPDEPRLPVVERVQNRREPRLVPLGGELGPGR